MRDQEDRIEPDPDHPLYWRYSGGPIMLLGGSVEDNLFQVDNVRAQLDLLRSVGGNYVRCTMSSRDKGNVWPFKVKSRLSGRYDLRRFNTAYWDRFEGFVRAAHERDIIVQIELWGTFDYYREPWNDNPFNPKNNVNYSSAELGLPELITTHPTRTENPFFWSVPSEHDNQVVLEHQQRFVDRILELSLNFGNVLYCIDNETSVTPRWSAYWADYILRKARAADGRVQTTEMWDAWDLAHPMHRSTINHSELYTFIEVPQNNHLSGQRHWDNLGAQRQRVVASGQPRPLTNVKIYGADTGPWAPTATALSGSDATCLPAAPRRGSTGRRRDTASA